MEENRIADGVLWFVAFLFSTTVHEAMHAWVAWRGGDTTAYAGGQVSLSPIPHIKREPIGMLVVPLLTALTQGWSLGWASTPYNPYWASRYPRRAAWMGAAGPAGNLAIAAAVFVVLKLGLLAGLFEAPASANYQQLVAASAALPALALPAKILSIFLMLNVLLFVFNLLPIPPLDGASAIGVILPEAAAAAVRNLARTPGFSLIGLLVAWKVFPFIAHPLFGLVLSLLHPGVAYTRVTAP